MFLKSKSKREVLERVRKEMRGQIDKAGAPLEVHAFLLESWSRLLAEIYLAKGNEHTDWRTGWETAQALLWSLAPKRGREETTALLRMLPTLLGRLHAGCAALAMPLEERDALFERLAMLHAALAREGLQARPEEEGPVTRLRVEEMTPALESDLHDLNPPELTAAKRPPTLPELRPGDRVGFAQEDGEHVRELAWISPMGGMYLFTNAQGFDALTLTQARLEAKFAAGEAWLPDQPSRGESRT